MQLQIERVDMVHLRIPLWEPFQISTGVVAEKDTILVAIHAGGLVGYGESSPMAGGFYRPETPESCWAELQGTILPSLIGQEVATPADIAGLMDPMPASNFAKAGPETALWDILGQAEGKPIAELLGGTRDRVESGLAVGLYATTDELLDRIERYLSDGYHRVKIKIKPGQDVRLVHAVRDRFGDRLPLMVDANAAYTIDDLRVFKELDHYGLMMYEQPLGADDLDGLAELQASVETPVCVDESAESPERTEELIRRECCRIVNIKIQRVGGLGPALRVHDICQQAGIPCWVGTMPELGIGQAAGIHLGSLPNCELPTDVEPSLRWFTDDYSEPLVTIDPRGQLRVPKAPGLGYAVNFEKVERYRVRQESFRRR